MSQESTAIVRAAEQMIDAIIDWREAHGLTADSGTVLSMDLAKMQDLCNHFRSTFDDDND